METSTFEIGSVETDSSRSKRELSLNSRQLAVFAHAAIEEKKGCDPLILDLRRLTDIADFFLLTHGTSDRHVRTLADVVLEYLGKKKLKPLHVEGMRDASWILLDYGSVIVHVFHHETRKFYNLERLWGDAHVLKAVEKHERQVKRTRRSSAA